MDVHECACMCMYVYVYGWYDCVYVHVCACMCMYVYTCVCMCINALMHACVFLMCFVSTHVQKGKHSGIDNFDPWQ